MSVGIGELRDVNILKTWKVILAKQWDEVACLELSSSAARRAN